MNTRRAKAAVLAGVAVLAAGMAPAQVAVSPWKSPHVTFTDQNGVALAGGCVFTYTGGTSTPLATYTDSTGSTPNANPAILDSTGSAQIWLGPYNYKFAIWSTGGTNCATGTLEWTVDMVPGNLFNNTTVTGGTWSGGTITGAAIGGGTIAGAAITTSTLDSSPVGQTTPSTGRFTSLAAGFDTMAFSSTPVFPAGTYGYFSLTLTNNVTSSTITGPTPGQLITSDICQDGTGGHTFAWPANYKFPPAVNPVANSCTVTTAFYDGSFWNTVSTTPQTVIGNYYLIPFSATPIIPAGAASDFAITLTGNVTSSTTVGAGDGQVIFLNVCQDGTGGHTLAWPANFINPPGILSGPNQCTGVTAFYDSAHWAVTGTTAATVAMTANANVPAIAFSNGATGALVSGSNDSAGQVAITANVTSPPAVAFTITFGGTYFSPMFCVSSMNNSGNYYYITSAPSMTGFTATDGSSFTGLFTYYCHQ